MESHHSAVSTIETHELAALLENDAHNVKVVCATWYFGSNAPDGAKEFEEAHIPTSIYFGIADIADKSSGLLATLPNKEDFTKEMKRLGIKKNHTVVIYENKMIFAGPRAAWMLRVYGAHDVRILNGCLTKWQAEGRSVESGPHTDFNDTSDDGYAFERNDELYENTLSSMQKVYAKESK